MEVEEFDDRKICHSHNRPTFFVEQWSWQYYEGTQETHSLICATYILSDCELYEALTWCEQNQAEPGSFVLHAANWTNHGYLQTILLTGRGPGDQRIDELSSDAPLF